MKTKEELLEEIYSHFPESKDRDETIRHLISDCIEAAITYWNTLWPKTKSIRKYYSEEIWEDVKSGESLEFGGIQETGNLNLENIAKALNTIKTHSHSIYTDLQSENWDTYTCDEFFQTVIFGEVIFG